MSSTTAELGRPVILPRADASIETPAKPRRRALIVLPVLALAAAGATTGFVLAGRGHQTTDDAQIEGHVANVAPRIGGQVQSVLVKDNQRVQAGELLVQLDDRDAKARLSMARADLAAARALLKAAETQLALTGSEVTSNLVVAKGGLAQAAAVGGTTRAAIAQAQADVASASAQHALAQSELTRTQKLFAEGALSEAQLDARKRALEQTEAGVAQARARLASAESNLDNSSGTLQNARGRLLLAESGPQRLAAASAQVELAQARMEQAEAALEQAELNLSYTQIHAAVSGVVSRRSVEPGQLVSPDRPLLAVVALDDTWVVANFKEDQIAELHPGSAATVTVDAYPGRKWTGHVESLSAGTGSRFSLLPPDNASGNFTKVVQRVPVLIRLDAHEGTELRPGLSVVAKVSTK